MLMCMLATPFCCLLFLVCIFYFSFSTGKNLCIVFIISSTSDCLVYLFYSGIFSPIFSSASLIKNGTRDDYFSKKEEKKVDS
jgi:hypothetical protein